MSRAITTFRALTVCLGQHPCREEHALLAAYFGLAERLANVKERVPRTTEADVNRPAATPHEPKETAFPSTPATATSPTSPTHSLPLELLSHIFARFLPSADVYTCLLVCRRWFRAAIPVAYRHPEVRSVRALRALMHTLNHDPKTLLWPYAAHVRRIYFGADYTVSLNKQSDPAEAGCDFFKGSYSALFALLVLERNRGQTVCAHPIFFDMSLQCPNLAAIEESVDDDPQKEDVLETIAQPNHLTGTVLQSLLAACRSVSRTSARYAIRPQNLTRVCTLLLGLLEGEERAMWRGISKESLRVARLKILESCRITLNQLSTSMFLEAQYLALSAQRLLDLFAILYYRGHHLASRLDVNFAIRAAEKEAREEYNWNATLRRHSEITNQTPSTGGEGSTSGRADNDEQLPYHPLPPRDVSAVVLECLRLIFRRHIPAHTAIPPAPPAEADITLPWPSGDGADDTEGDATETNTRPSSPPPPLAFPTRHFLTTALSVFPPAGMNPETAELLSQILTKHTLASASSPTTPPPPPTDPTHLVQSQHWLAYFREIVEWQRCGVEMEAVKDLLRTSMARMEMYRGLQVNAGSRVF
ncbi:uncharacterized protein EV422DRAFT_529899 [Fimicolochytrium jonesii]|uniref:uncharacterized protein n=1 Tax=Fimicolochytrium jonesii TaxID=1396493 RepID=UPI0022FDF223|nr:uncharacterized protein EV422DRAFT_529899 [Fimicolochytrium jonesii]KAI8820725.1 hypothetical protein EV422DRAFT_529899 [Fimicolochytrium jonesii]